MSAGRRAAWLDSVADNCMSTGRLGERTEGVRMLRVEVRPDLADGCDMWETAESLRFTALFDDGETLSTERQFTAAQKECGKKTGTAWSVSGDYDIGRRSHE